MAARTSTKTVAPAVEMTQEEALAILMNSPIGAALAALIPGGVAQEPVATAPAKGVSLVKTPAPATTADDVVAAFLTSKNLGFAKGGRTYVTDELVKAEARVLKTGKPEFVAAAEGSYTAGLLVARDDKGRTYTQNVRNLPA